MMRIGLLAGGALGLALVSGLALAQSGPESLLPPGFEDPKPKPTSTPSPRPSAAPSAPATTPAGGATSVPVIQPVGAAGTPAAPAKLPDFAGKLPSLDQLERMSTDQLDELFGLKPKVDIPAGARRSLEQVGVLSPAEGGLPTFSLANQPASLVRAALAHSDGPVVSRWGHILLRRALASRLEAPKDMDPVEFAALRARALGGMGEYAVARALAQDVDTQNWNPALTAAAIDAYIGTADLVGACPAVRLQGNAREDANWRLLQGICSAFAGEAARGKADLNRVRSRGQAASIDALLALRYAGAAGEGRGAVTIEWTGIDALTPMRFALANAVGEPVPDTLLDGASPYYSRVAAVAPMLGLPRRIAASDLAAREGILSSSAVVDLYSQAYDEEDLDGPGGALAQRLRQAYVAADPATRLAAIKDLWKDGGGSGINYGRLVLTAYAAARLEPSEDFADDAGPLIVSMLSAGFERDALRWAGVVPQGSAAWAQLMFAAPNRRDAVSTSAIDDFVDDDTGEKRKAQFLVAGLAGLGRLSPSDTNSYSADLKMGLGNATRWTRAIDQAAAVNNQALVALLAGLGMQGSDWKQMTPRHLYHIVGALNRVGLNAEARMIAAEAVARG